MLNGHSAVTVDQFATVLFTGTQHLSALNILPGGTARMVQYGSYVLDTGSLDIGDGGLLDLSDNDMIVRSGDLPTIAGLLASGYDHGAWDSNTDRLRRWCQRWLI